MTGRVIVTVKVEDFKGNVRGSSEGSSREAASDAGKEETGREQIMERIRIFNKRIFFYFVTIFSRIINLLKFLGKKYAVIILIFDFALTDECRHALLFKLLNHGFGIFEAFVRCHADMIAIGKQSPKNKEVQQKYRK